MGSSSSSRAIDDCHVSFLFFSAFLNLFCASNFFFLSFSLVSRFFPVQFELDVSPSHFTRNPSSVILEWCSPDLFKLSYFFLFQRRIKGDKWFKKENLKVENIWLFFSIFLFILHTSLAATSGESVNTSAAVGTDTTSSVQTRLSANTYK